jgi:putative sterol carrier protein
MTDLVSITQRVRTAVGEESGLDARIKFNFGADGFLSIDGKARPNQVDNTDAPADIALTVSMHDFERIIDKKLNPKFALMTGKMRLKGDIRIAMRLDKVFGLD